MGKENRAAVTSGAIKAQSMTSVLATSKTRERLAFRATARHILIEEPARGALGDLKEWKSSWPEPAVF